MTGLLTERQTMTLRLRDAAECAYANDLPIREGIAAHIPVAAVEMRRQPEDMAAP
jgi:hypothetical protein